MLTLKSLHLSLLLGVFLVLITISLNHGLSNANPFTPNQFARRDDENPYPDDDQIREDMEVEKDKSVFFSNCRDSSTPAYNFGQTVGAEIVRNTLPDEYTVAKKPYNEDQHHDFMRRFSRIFAQKSSGTTYFVTRFDEEPKKCSIWVEIELPELQRDDGGVDKIIKVDCDNFENREVFWERNESSSSSSSDDEGGVFEDLGKRHALVQKRDDDICYEKWITEEQWEFGLYQNDRCSGQVTKKTDVGKTSCRTGILNGSANAHIATNMTDTCEVMLYSDSHCKTRIGKIKADDDGCIESSDSILSFLVNC